MAVCLGIGIVLWYAFRVSIIGRWRDVIRVLLLSCLCLPAAAQDIGTSKFAGPWCELNHVAGQSTVTLVEYWLGDDVWYDQATIQLVKLPGSWQGTAWVRYSLTGAVQDQQTGEINYNWQGPVKMVMDITPDLPDYQVQVSVDGHVGESLVYSDSTVSGPLTRPTSYAVGQLVDYNDATLAADMDDPAFNIAMGVRFRGHFWWGGGEGSEADSGNYTSDADPERERLFDFGQDGIIHDDEPDGGLPENIGSALLTGNDDIKTAAQGFDLPLTMPQLASAGSVGGAVDSIMTSLIGTSWTTSNAAGTDGKLLGLFGETSWSGLVSQIIYALEQSRQTYPAVFDIAKTFTTVLVAWFTCAWVYRLYSAAFGWRMINPFGNSEAGDVR